MTATSKFHNAISKPLQAPRTRRKSKVNLQHVRRPLRPVSRKHGTSRTGNRLMKGLL